MKKLIPAAKIISGIKSAVNSRLRLAARKRLLLAGLALVLSALGGYYFLSIARSANPGQVNLNAAYQDECALQDNATFGCYRKLLEKITNERSPKEAFDLVKQQYDSVPYVKSQCHQLAHVIGRTALAKHKNISDTFSLGDKYCWSGYYHGAMEELVDSRGYDYIVKQANEVCAPIAASARGSFYHYNCVHGLGHGFMMVQEGELFKSLKACDSLDDSWERTSCYGGVYMQNIMNAQGPDAVPDQAPKYLRSDDLVYPCNAVEDKYKFPCYQMQTSHMLSVAGYDFSRIFAVCATVEEKYRSTCYESLGRDASGSTSSDVAKTKASCSLGRTEEAVKYCISGAAKDFVSYFHSDKQALELCASLEDNLSNDCRGVVQSYYSSF